MSTAETEDQLIVRAQQALSHCNWEIGECAAEWTKRYARGRTDADFGALIGLSGDQVYQRRRVWETFSDVRDQYAQLRWSHFYAAINWPDAAECLQWAQDLGATVAEMKAWRRAQHGEDLTQPGDEAPPFALDDDSPQFLKVTDGEVHGFDSGDGQQSRRAAAGHSDHSADEAFGPATAMAVARESESEYAPFGKGARGPAPGEASTRSSVPPLQALKRIVSALERADAALTPEVLEAVPQSPIKLQQRLHAAIEGIVSKTSGLQ